MDLKLTEFGRLLPHRATPALFVGPSQVRAYWEGLRVNGSIPERSQLDPRGLGGVLDRVFVAEAIGKGLVQVRIAGSALAEATGMDLRGLPLSCLFSADARPRLAEALQSVITGEGVVELDLGDAIGRGTLARLLLLPLADGPDRRLVLGCLGSAEAKLGPRVRFEILRKQEERLAPVAPAAAPVVVDLSPPMAARRVRHLTLVHDRN